MIVEEAGERIAVSTRIQDDGQLVYDFLWIDGPGESEYGFTLGLSTHPAGASQPTLTLTDDEIEQHARQFVRAFFAPDGIGPSDFPDFVAARRDNGR